MTPFVATVLIKPLVVLQLILNSPIEPPAIKPVATASFEAGMYVTKTQKIRLSISKTASEGMTITLRQADQPASLFSHYLGRKVTKKTLVLDVDQLPDGRYEFDIKTASGWLTKQIDLCSPAKVTIVERQLILY